MKMEPEVDSYPLSPLQQGMLFHSLTAPQSGVDLEQIWCGLNENVDAAALQRAWQRVVDRHAILRTTFHWNNGTEPRQQVQPHFELQLEKADWRQKSSLEQEALFEKSLQTDRERGFRLSEAPPLRVALFRLAEARYRLVWTFHHLLADGRAVVLVLKEVFDFYEAFLHGEDLVLPPAQAYRSFIDWLQGQELSAAETFWRGNLKGFSGHSLPGLSRDFPTSSSSGELVSEQAIGLSEKATARLKSIAREAGVTTNTVLQGAWALLLSRYGGEEDVIFGAVRAGRRSSVTGADSVVGLFINTVPMRVKVIPELPVVAWLQRLRESWRALRDYEHASLARVQQWSGIPGGQPLFETLFNYQDPSWDAALRAQGGVWAAREFGIRSQSNYPLVVDAYGGQALLIKILYHRERFEGETIARMLGHFKTLLEEMAANPARPVREVSMLTRAERHQVLVEWNDTAMEVPGPVTALELLERQVARTPQALAVTNADNQLTYDELNKQAARLAHLLRQLGVGPGARVGVCLERSPEMVVACVAVWKAGGAYVPLDPLSPPERLAFMLRDANVPVVVTKSCWREIFSATAPAPHAVFMDMPLEAGRHDNSRPLGSGPKPTDLAYVIYTSGSTGTPKGVEIEHRSLVNLIIWHQRTYQVKPADRASQIAAPTFDASVWELWPYLTAGASVHIPTEETRLSPSQLAEWLVSTAITVAFIPTPLLERMLDLAWPQPVPLRAILTGGDQLHHAPGANFPCALINHYGPTESTVVATWTPVPPTERNGKPPSIGRPIANTRVYILDAQQHPVPIGVAGELHVGGAGLARGYLGRPDLTAEKFICNPFEKSGGGRLYKTGDLARWRADGQIEFLGRLDHQVKIRGQRIELGEIESALNQHPAVRESLAMVLGDGADARLTAWVVPSAGHSPSSHELRRFLKQKLPDTMVPWAFVTVDSFPLTPNGKVDRKALPIPAIDRAARFIAPRNPTEELLAGIWREILGIKAPGIQDNFFELGGHSLLATQAMSRVRNAFQVELPLRSLFDAPTLEALAQRIDQARKEAQKPTMPPLSRRRENGNGSGAVSFAQERLWFMEQMEPGLAVNNIPLAIHLSGVLDVTALEKSLDELVCRHEAFRTVFSNRQGFPVAVIEPAQPLVVPLLDLGALPPGQRDIASERLTSDEARRPFDLTRGPLLRATLLRFSAEEHLLLLTTHHIACDGWSLDVCYRELSAFYMAFKQGGAPSLGRPPLDYSDFVHWQREWLDSGVQDNQLAYWKRHLDGATPVLELPTDRPRPALQTYRGAVRHFRFQAALSAGLERVCLQEDVTLFMVLLAALQTLLHRYSGQDDILVGTPIAGRPRAETENLVGLFLNTLVMRGDCSGDPTFRDLLKRVRQTALDAYAHQDLPFERLVGELRPERDLGRSPVFQVMFVLQNEPLRPLELPGLKLKPVPTHSGTAKFDLLFSVEPDPGGLSGFVEYNTELFDETTIARAVEHFQMLLEGAMSAPHQKISALPLMTAQEQRRVLSEWNETQAEFPGERCIHELVEAQVSRTPDAVAVVFEQEHLTYGELNRRADQLAGQLRSLGVGPDVRVGLCMNRSLELIVGMLGILKAGGCYVPLDPAYPKERLAFMLEDSGAPVILTQPWLNEALSFEVPGLKTVLIDSAQGTSCGATPKSCTASRNLAYVLYTSGSTGKPKGVMVTHRNVVNFFAGMDQLLGVEPGVWLAVTSISFDISVLELLWTLERGFKVVLQPEELPALAARGQQCGPVSGPSRSVAEQLPLHGVTHFQCTPSLARMLASTTGALEALGTLDTLLVGGEALPVSLAGQLRSSLSGQLINMYGPTETTVWSASHRVEELVDVVPIGRPLANTQIYILDQNLQPMPTGVAGEIVIGGEGVTRGYLNRAELTSEKFVKNPFGTEADERLYRTGDLGRFRADGTIEFLGRLDNQVKIRGHRIEPGEIEAALERFPGVRQAVVVAREDSPGEKRLVAYLASPGEIETSELRRFLEARLPEPMRPSAFVILETLPMTPNGKVNRRALRAPDSARPRLETAYRAPETALESTVAEVWQQLLGVDTVGVDDNFFDLGGHSLLVVLAQVILQEKLQRPVPVLKLFQYPTVRALAGFLAGPGETSLPKVSDRGRRKQTAFARRKRPEEVAA